MKLHKVSIIYKGLSSRNFFLGLFITFPLIAAGGIQTVLGLSAFVIFLTSSLIYSFFYWSRYNYEVTEDSFDIKKGVIRKKNREIPLHRIQNVDISSDLIQRILGISQVNLETAGGGQTEARLRFVSLEEARRIQDKIKRLKKRVEQEEKDKEVEEDDKEEEERRLVFELDSKELTVLSLFSVDNRSIALVFFIFTLFAGSIWASMERLGASGSTISLVLTSLAITTIWLISSFRIFSKYYGFKLYKNQDAYEYERGLIQRYSGSIPEEKIQVVIFDENPLKRFFNYSTVRLETAGYSPGRSTDRGSEALIPLATKERAINLAQSIKSFESLQMNSIPSRSRYRYFFRYTLASTILFVVLLELAIFTETAFVLPDVPTRLNYVFLPGLILFSAAGAHLKWVNKGYSRNKNHYITRNGFWRRKTVVMPYYRIQNVICTQTILQRKWRLSTVLLDTAGSGLLGASCRAVDIDEDKAVEERKHILESFFKSLEDRN